MSEWDRGIKAPVFSACSAWGIASTLQRQLVGGIQTQSYWPHLPGTELLQHGPREQGRWEVPEAQSSCGELMASDWEAVGRRELLSSWLHMPGIKIPRCWRMGLRDWVTAPMAQILFLLRCSWLFWVNGSPLAAYAFRTISREYEWLMVVFLIICTS